MEIIGHIGIVEIEANWEHISNPDRILNLTQNIINTLEMTPIGKPHLVSYPSESVAADTMTIFQPICVPFTVFQPLQQSFLAFDNWKRPDQNLGYANFLINSCKGFDLTLVKNEIQRDLSDARLKSSYLYTYYPMKTLGLLELPVSSNVRNMLIREILENELLPLLTAKGNDYSGNDVFSNFYDFGLAGIIARLGDKYHRIKNLILNGSAGVQKETIEDTLIDLINYGFIALLFYRLFLKQ